VAPQAAKPLPDHWHVAVVDRDQAFEVGVRLVPARPAEHQYAHFSAHSVVRGVGRPSVTGRPQHESCGKPSLVALMGRRLLAQHSQRLGAR